MATAPISSIVGSDGSAARPTSRYLAERQQQQRNQQQLQDVQSDVSLVRANAAARNEYADTATSSAGNTLDAADMPSTATQGVQPSPKASLTTASHRPRAASGEQDLGGTTHGSKANSSRRPSRQPAAGSQLPPGAPSGSRINTVTYKTATIKALIDPSLRVKDVIRQLCANSHLGVQEPSALFALRDEGDDELIDDSNMARKIAAGRNFKLCSSPTLEAAETVEKLSTHDERVVKLATHNLQRLIREKAFFTEFSKRGGLQELIQIILSLESGNTLAYALTSVQNLLESRDEGWEDLGSPFIHKIVNLLTTQERINVCRPATAILRKLVVSGPDNAQEEEGKVIGDAEGSPEIDGANAMTKATSHENDKVKGEIPKTYRYGFEAIYAEISKEPVFLQTLTQRLGSPDTTLCLYSLSLINSLMRNVSHSHFDEFTAELEQFNVSGAVSRLMDSSRGEEISSTILEYQHNVIRSAYRRLQTTVKSTDKRHVGALSYIWLHARIPEHNVEDEKGGVQKHKWRRLGFESENVAKDFSRTGWLGLECCESYVRTSPDRFATSISEDLHKPESRRFPWGKASLEVVEILIEYYDIEAGYSAVTHFQPCLLSLTRLHYLATRFFWRMWNESGAGFSDFQRVSALVRTQLKEALREEASKSWRDVEASLLQSDYRMVRERQMRELQTEDDFTNKASIRNLRSRLYRESYEFVRQQRIQCLLEGAWFRNPSPNSTAATVGITRTSKTLSASANGALSQIKPWRFYRLSPNKKYLYYCESSEKGPIRSGLDDLPERIDLGLMTDMNLQTQPQANGARDKSTNLSFSILRAPDVSLADFVALNASQFSEWTDGLSMLRSEGGLVNTKETADFIQILTDIGVRIKLLDLTGEQVEIPSAVEPVPLPQTTSFFFADL